MTKKYFTVKSLQLVKRTTNYCALKSQDVTFKTTSVDFKESCKFNKVTGELL